MANTTLTERVRLSNSFTLDFLASLGTFTKRILKKWPTEEGYKDYESPMVNSENYLVSFGPSDLHSFKGQPPNLKK